MRLFSRYFEASISSQSAGMCRETKTKSCLDPAVAPVGHDDVPGGVHGHAGGGVELAVALAVGAEFEQELAVCVVHLGRDITLDERKRTRRRRRPKSAASFFTFTEWL